MKTTKTDEKRRRGRPSKQITVYNEKKVNKTKKEIVKEENELICMQKNGSHISIYVYRFYILFVL